MFKAKLLFYVLIILTISNLFLVNSLKDSTKSSRLSKNKLITPIGFTLIPESFYKQVSKYALISYEFYFAYFLFAVDLTLKFVFPIVAFMLVLVPFGIFNNKIDKDLLNFEKVEIK